MLKWLEDYYVGKSIDAPVKLQADLNAGRTVPLVYLVTLARSKNNILEIIPGITLASRHARRRCRLIIAMAGSKQEAMELVRDIVDQVYRKTGGVDVEGFIKSR